MRAEVQKSMEFSLPQAQVFYISSRNKFILVKNNKIIFRFLLLCPAVRQFRPRPHEDDCKRKR